LRTTAGVGVGTVAGVGISEPVKADHSQEDVVAGDDLIAWWPFEDNFDDVVGDNDASPDKGDPTINTHEGRTAVEFDGDDALRISRGGHSELNVMHPDHGPVTFSMWVYLDETSGEIYRQDTGIRIEARETEDGQPFPRFRSG